MNELQALCEAAVEGTLTPEQLATLESCIVADTAARRFYIEYMHQHATLHWSAAEPHLLPMPQVRAVPRPRRRRVFAVAGFAASLLLGVTLWALHGERDRPQPSIATLHCGKACKWDGGSLPTDDGARLTAGRLRLAEGVARVTFDNGVEVMLEAPADLELVSLERCVLHAGRLVARVPDAAIGFIVDTPSAVVKDLGTEFGVHVKEDRCADVQVFNGKVDVQHKTSGRTEHMETGKNLRFTPANVAEFDPNKEQPSSPRVGVRPENARVVQISTAMGRGKDTYVQPLFPSQHMSDVLLLVKNTVDDKSDYNRKAYMGFDLASLQGMKVLEAQLSLTFTATAMGFASEVPDATFTLYGMTDDSLDDWDEKTMRWANAPANKLGGANLDEKRVVKLGTFEIVQGLLSGTRGIASDALVEFLNGDRNGLATVILVRETKGSGRNDLVHGFASKDHPTLPPPTLKLVVAPK